MDPELEARVRAVCDEELKARVRAVCDLAEMEGWDEERTEKALSKAHREYHLACLNILAATYRLEPENVEDCRRKIIEKFPD